MVGSTREVETSVSITNESTVEYEEGKDEVNDNSFGPHSRNVVIIHFIDCYIYTAQEFTISSYLRHSNEPLQH